MMMRWARYRTDPTALIWKIERNKKWWIEVCLFLSFLNNENAHFDSTLCFIPHLLHFESLASFKTIEKYTSFIDWRRHMRRPLYTTNMKSGCAVCKVITFKRGGGGWRWYFLCCARLPFIPPPPRQTCTALYTYNPKVFCHCYIDYTI